MSLELTITAKGQVTLKQAVLDHLNVAPGQKVSVTLLPDGRVELNQTGARTDIRKLRGLLRQKGRKPVSLEEMQAAIEAGASS